MKVIHVIPSGANPILDDVHQAVERFYIEHKMKPNVVRMSMRDTSMFLKSFYNVAPILTLEEGKKYANYVNSPCGPIRLDLLEEDEVIIQSGHHSGAIVASSSLIVVENKEIDEEFEKHVLNEGK